MNAARQWLVTAVVSMGWLIAPAVASSPPVNSRQAHGGTRPQGHSASGANPQRLTRQQLRWVGQARAVAASLDTAEEQDLGAIRIAAAVCRRAPRITDDILRQAYQDLTASGETDTAGQPRSARSSDSLPSRANLELRIAAGNCDPSLVARLNRRRHDKAAAYKAAASGALQQIQAGQTQDAVQTLRGAIRNGDFTQAQADFQTQAYALFSVIMTLRPKQPENADALYLLELEKVQSAPSLLDVRGLALLGAYPFMATGVPAPADPTAVVFDLPVSGETSPLPGLNALRPGENPQVATAYLQLAVALLGDPSLHGDQASYAAALANELTPLVERYAPAEESALGLDRQQLALNAPASQQPTAQPHAFSLDQIEKIADPALRNGLLLTAVAEFWRQQKFDPAEEFTRHVTDGALRQRLNTLIVFGRARATLSAGDLNTAGLIAGRLPKGRERVLLLCGLAAADRAQQKLPAALDELSLARDTLAQVPALDRAGLDLTVAGLLARLDPVAARTFLSTLTSDLNQLDAELDDAPATNAPAAEIARRQELLHERERPGPINWTETLRSGPFSATFSLDIPGVSSPGFADIPALLHLSGDDAFAWLAGVTSSRRRLQILPGLLAALLQQQKSTPAPRAARAG